MAASPRHDAHQVHHSFEEASEPLGGAFDLDQPAQRRVLSRDSGGAGAGI